MYAIIFPGYYFRPIFTADNVSIRIFIGDLHSILIAIYINRKRISALSFISVSTHFAIIQLLFLIIDNPVMITIIVTKDYDKAGEYLAKLEGIVNNNISRYELARAKALILQSRGDYRKALAAIDSAAVEVQESEFDLNAVRKI